MPLQPTVHKQHYCRVESKVAYGGWIEIREEWQHHRMDREMCRGDTCIGALLRKVDETGQMFSSTVSRQFCSEMMDILTQCYDTSHDHYDHKQDLYCACVTDYNERLALKSRLSS